MFSLRVYRFISFFFFFFFNDTATTEIYTLSLHDALPISCDNCFFYLFHGAKPITTGDRKSTRLNSSHTVISYAVFCLKKKKKTNKTLNNKKKKKKKKINTIIKKKK